MSPSVSWPKFVLPTGVVLVLLWLQFRWKERKNNFTHFLPFLAWRAVSSLLVLNCFRSCRRGFIRPNPSLIIIIKRKKKGKYKILITKGREGPALRVECECELSRGHVVIETFPRNGHSAHFNKKNFSCLKRAEGLGWWGKVWYKKILIFSKVSKFVAFWSPTKRGMPDFRKGL